MVFWITIFSWALLVPGCEPQFEVPGEIDINVQIVGDSGIAIAPLLVELEDTPLVEVPEVDAGAEPELDDRPIHERWFGDSGWFCCTAEDYSICPDLCDEGEVPTTNGIGTICCSPDIGQCADLDGGV